MPVFLSSLRNEGKAKVKEKKTQALKISESFFKKHAQVPLLPRLCLSPSHLYPQQQALRPLYCCTRQSELFFFVEEKKTEKETSELTRDGEFALLRTQSALD